MRKERGAGRKRSGKTKKNKEKTRKGGSVRRKSAPRDGRDGRLDEAVQKLF